MPTKRLTISETIRRAAKNSGRSINELARACDLSPSIVSRFLGGAGINSDTLDRLAQELGVGVQVKSFQQKRGR